MCLCCFKQKTAYEMRISDWSSDVCSSDLDIVDQRRAGMDRGNGMAQRDQLRGVEQRLRLLDQVAAIFTDQHRALGAGIGVTELDAQQKSIELRIGQDRESVGSGKSASVRVDSGGRRIIY